MSEDQGYSGTLQSNKVNKCLDLFDTVDSVDSTRLAKKIDKRSKALGKTMPILLEVNTSKEEQKHGFWPDKIDDMILCTTLKNISVKGLMTLGPRSKDEKETRRAFSLLRKIKDKINYELGDNQLIDLSMVKSPLKKLNKKWVLLFLVKRTFWCVRLLLSLVLMFLPQTVSFRFFSCRSDQPVKHC